MKQITIQNQPWDLIPAYHGDHTTWAQEVSTCGEDTTDIFHRRDTGKIFVFIPDHKHVIGPVENLAKAIELRNALIPLANEAEEFFGHPPSPGESFSLFNHLIRQRQFSLHAFGPHPRLLGVASHIEKEVAEIRKDPTDIKEWIDVVILGFDGAMRAGHNPSAIIEALVAKQEENEGRSWPDWRGVPEDQAIEHHRS
jgi:hypothetical protein